AAFERVVAEMPEHVRARAGLERARAEIERVAELERQRRSAERARESMEARRDRASPGARVHEAAWASGETARDSGIGAMTGGDFAVARARFDAAAESYDLVAGALDRQVQQGVAAARLELAERRFDVCLERADEVLALVGDQPDALALRREAE